MSENIPVSLSKVPRLTNAFEPEVAGENLSSIEDILGFSEIDFYALSRGQRVNMLFPDYSGLIQAEGRDIKMVTPEFVRRFNLIHRGQDKTGLKNITWSTLVDPAGSYRFGLAERSLFEGNSWPMAMAMTTEVRYQAQRWFESNGFELNEFKMFELGTGSGAISAAAREDLSNSGQVDTKVDTVERESKILFTASENFDALGITGVRFFNLNAVDLMREMEPNGISILGYPYGLAFLELPFRSAYERTDIWINSLTDMYLLSEAGWNYDKKTINYALKGRKQEAKIIVKDLEDDVIVNGEEVVALALQKLAPVVAIHIPMDVTDQSLKDSASRIGANVISVTLKGKDGKRNLEEKMAIFLENGEEASISTKLVTF